MKIEEGNKFYLHVKTILEDVMVNPELSNTNYTYILLLYFISMMHYKVIEIEIDDHGIPKMIGKPVSDKDILTISLMDILATNSKKAFDIQGTKPLSLLYAMLVLYEDANEELSLS
jgi:hypothetical protein